MSTNSLPNIFWKKWLVENSKTVWCRQHSILPQNLIPSLNNIFNNIIAPNGGAFAEVFPCDSKKYEINIHYGFSAHDFLHVMKNNLKYKGGDERLSSAKFKYFH